MVFFFVGLLWSVLIPFNSGFRLSGSSLDHGQFAANFFVLCVDARSEFEEIINHPDNVSMICTGG